MDLVDLDGQSINDPVVNNDVEVPTVNNASVHSYFDLSDDDAGLQEILRIFEETVEYNKRERSSRKRKLEEEEEFENVDWMLLLMWLNRWMLMDGCDLVVHFYQVTDIKDL